MWQKWITKSRVWTILLVSFFVATVSRQSRLPCTLSTGSHDSSVGIATSYGLDCTGIKSRRGRDYPHLCKPTLRLTQPLVQWIPCLFPGGKSAGAWHWPPTPSSAEVKERVALSLLAFVACSRVNFTLTSTLHWVPIGFKFSRCKGDRRVKLTN
jgi:hypothetical protein